MLGDIRIRGLYLKKYTEINGQTIFSADLMSFIDKKPKLNKEWTEKKYDKSHGQLVPVS